MDNTQQLRERLVKLLHQGSAFKPLPETLESILYKVTGLELEGFSHTAYHGGQIAMLSKAIERQQ